MKGHSRMSSHSGFSGRRIAGLTGAVALVATLALALTATLFPSQNTIVGTVTNPTSAYADDGVGALVSANNSTLDLSGFDATDLGVITDVTVWVEYLITATPNNDSYTFQVAVDGVNFNQTIVPATTDPQPTYTTASLSLGAISWAQVGTLAVRCVTSKSQGADGYSVDVDVAYLMVTYSGANNAPTISATKADDGGGNLTPNLTTCSSNNVTISATVDDSDGNPLDWTIFTDDGGGYTVLPGCSATGATPPAAASCTITGITAGTQYYVEVTDGIDTTRDPVDAPTSSYNITLDTIKPAATTIACAAASSNQIDLTLGGGETGVLVVRGPNTGACPSFTPVDGTSYSAPSTQGSDTIIYVGAGASHNDTGLDPDTTYCYEIWARDDCFNYAADPPGTSSCTTDPAAGDVTTLGDGSDPTAGPSLCPGDAATVLDAFSFQTTGNSDQVTDVTVGLAAGTSAGLAKVEVTSGDGLTVYGFVDNPATDTVTVPLTQTTLTATGSPVEYRIRVTPKADLDMPAPPGTIYAVTGTVTSFTPTANSTAGTDIDSDTVTIDNESPANLSWSGVTPGDNQLDLAWSNPGGDPVVILRNTGPISDTPDEGATYSAPTTINTSDVVYTGTGSAFSDTGVSNGTDYWYKIFVRDTCINYSTGAETGPVAPGVGGSQVVTIRSSAKSASDPGQWTWSGAELGDQNDGTIASVGAGSQILRSEMGDDAGYACRAINGITVWVRAQGTGGGQINEQMDFGVYGGTPADHYSGTPATPSKNLWGDFSFSWSTRPWDGQPWTPTDIDALVVTVQSIANGGWNGTQQVSEIWVEVDYDPGSNVCATLTLGDGSDPGNDSRCPGGAETYLDQFTVRMDSGTATVTHVEVTFAGGTSASIGEVRITGTGGSPLYGAFTNPSDVQNIQLTTQQISATTAEVPYEVRITPRSHAAMPAPTGGLYNVTGVVSNVTADASVTGSDTNSAQIDIDNLSPSDPSSFSGTAGNQQVDLAWSNPADGDFDEVLVLRLQGSPVTDIPVEGDDYSGLEGTVPPAFSATVVYVGSLEAVTDGGLTNGNNYYYRIFAKDACGNYSTPGAAAGGYSPASQDGLEIVSNTATESSCTQITVNATFIKDANANSFTTVSWDTDAGFGTARTACGTLAGPSPRQCIVTGFTPGADIWVRVDHTDPDGVGGGTDPEDFGPINTTCGGDTAAPTVLVLSPSRQGTIGGIERFKVQIYDEGGLAAVDPVSWSVDGGSFSTAVTENTNYACGAGCSVYEINVDTRPVGLDLANGDHYLTIKANDAESPSNVAEISHHFTVNNRGAEGNPAGDGFLLRRSHGSGLCTDCHALKTHSSQHSSTKYGNWAMNCLDCHTPHGTTNIHLIREQVDTPSSGSHSVDFRFDVPSESNFKYLGDQTGAVYSDGICETCHTKTSKHRNDGTQDNAHEKDNTTKTCIDCHSHSGGFRGPACNDCHNAPPNVGKHWSHDEVRTLPGSYDNLGSNATATEYGFACKKCHSGTHISEPAAPYTVDVLFDDSVDPKNGGGSYTADGPSQTVDSGVNGDGWYWSNGTCSNLYCHSIAQRTMTPDTADYKTVTWDQAAALTCVSCHDDGGADSTLSGAHVTHTDGTTAGADYQFGCVRCHSNTVATGVSVINPGAVSNKAAHVDGVRTLFFDTSGPDNSGGSYSDSPSFTCSNTYCHSDGKDRNGDADNSYTSGPSIAWNTSATCTSCHSAGGSGTALSGPHEAHTWNGSPTQEAFSCVKCHSQTVSGDTTIATASNHVNAVADVLPKDWNDANGTFTPGSEGQGGCGGLYCHSSGQATPSFRTPAWNDSPSNVCMYCHGSEGGGTAGEPRYANGGTGLNNSNSHQAHVGSAADCVKCHSTTTTNGTSIATPANHIDASRQVVFGGGISGTYTNDSGQKQCSVPACHGAGTPQWGGPSLLCLDCHGGASDVDDYVYGNGTAAAISTDEWAWSGHGRTTGSYDVSGNSAANLSQNGEANTCLYCHAGSHGDSNNPFRLRFTAAVPGSPTADEMAAVCLNCHGESAPGVDLGNVGDPISSSAVVNAYHYTKDHGNGLDTANGGRFCWDCHDPHGDRTSSGVGNIEMIHRDVSRVTDGVFGVPDTTITGPPSGLVSPVFTNRAGFSDYGKTASPFNGVCNVCHTDSGNNNYKWDSAESPTHPTDPQGETTCTASCHTHDNGVSDAFVFGSAGEPINCLESGCHDVVNGARRNVMPDFGKQSHHVGDGSANMGGTLTAWDCVVCHAEGKDDGIEALPVSTSEHINGKIDLWDVDQPFDTFYVYDVDDVRSSAGAAANWNSNNQKWREWTSGVDEAGGAVLPANAGLDRFCITCHDADGATQTYNNRDGGGSAYNPFADGAITNEVDGAIRYEPPTVGDSVPPITVPGPEKVINVYDQVVDGGGDLDGDGSTDPPQGKFARHAIRGMGTSRYSTFDTGFPGPGQSIYQYGGFTSMGTDEFSNPLWNDTSVMGCADCHTSDGANTTAGNAHGSDSEYLLKDGAGGATEGTLDGDNYVCYRCHDISKHGPGTGHTANPADYVDTTGEPAGFRVLNDRARATTGVIFGIACLNCHGAPDWGTIHGTSQEFQRPDVTVRQSYRFMNGGSQRYYVDNGWGGTSITCWTLGAADEWGSCTKHDGGYTWTKPLQRPRDY